MTDFSFLGGVYL